MSETMTDQEKLKQISDQCRVVAQLATELAQLHTDYATIFAAGGDGPADIADIVGRRSASLMESLGDTLNGMDAVGDDIEWMEPVFAAAHKLYPTTP